MVYLPPLSPLFWECVNFMLICSSMIYQMIREKSGFQLPLFFAEFVDLFIYDSSYDSREVPEAFCGINAMERASMFLDVFWCILFNSFADKDGKKGSPSPQLSDGCPMPKCKQSPEMSSCLFRLKTIKTIIRSKWNLLIRVLISSQLLIAGWN